MKLDLYANRRDYSVEERRIAGDGILVCNKKLILRYNEERLAANINPSTVMKRSGQLRKIARILGKDFRKCSRSDVQRLMRVVSSGRLRCDNLALYHGKESADKMLSEETKKDYWRMIKCFFRYLKMEGVLDIQKPHFRSYKRFDGIITEEHVLKAVEKTISVRDKALLWVLHETGARVGELLNMRVQDVERNGHGAKVLLDGKTGPRKVMVVKSVPYLFRWLEMHPLGYDKTMFVWLADRSNDVLGRAGVCQIIKRAFGRAGLGHLQLNPHFFRHSRATIMAPHLTEAMMCKYFGWRIGSKMPGIYVHVTQEDVDNALCEMYGFEKSKGVIQENLPRCCPVCKQENPSQASFCWNCGSSFSVAEGMSADERYEKEMGKTMELLEKVMANPVLMERFVEWRRGKNQPLKS